MVQVLFFRGEIDPGDDFHFRQVGRGVQGHQRTGDRPAEVDRPAAFARCLGDFPPQFADGLAGGPIDHHAQGPLFVVLDQEDDRAGEVRVQQARRRQQEVAFESGHGNTVFGLGS